MIEFSVLEEYPSFKAYRLLEGSTTMRKHRVILGMVLFVLTLGTPGSQFAQKASTAEKSNQPSHDRWLVLGLLRTINTAEVAEISQFGSFASWQTLLAHNSQHFSEWLTRYYSRDLNVHFADLPEILPGLTLRLNVHADGRGYDVLLEDLGDKDQYGVQSDERGVIRECKPLQ